MFIRPGEFLNVTILKCVRYSLETSFPKAMDAQKREVMVLPYKNRRLYMCIPNFEYFPVWVLSHLRVTCLLHIHTKYTGNTHNS